MVYFFEASLRARYTDLITDSLVGDGDFVKLTMYIRFCLTMLFSSQATILISFQLYFDAGSSCYPDFYLGSKREHLHPSAT
jgi:hypothetical protein